jgi:radical SAM superfamily enzyme YgiQ (UPF0313 family)
LSVLSVGSGIEGRYDYNIVDENYDPNVEATLKALVRVKGVRYLGITVMPGPQLVRAVAISKTLKGVFPKLTIIWGGTFASLHTATVLASPYVDYVVRRQGEYTFRELIDALEGGGSVEGIRGLSYRRNGEIVHNAEREYVHPDTLPPIPFERIDLHKYLGRTYLGNKTTAYHSSYGCPFLCGFCAIAAEYKGRWLAKDPHVVAKDLLGFQKSHGVDSVEFFDDNFFVSQERTKAFASDILGHGISWWGEARIDTLMTYSDDTLALMRKAGSKMIFTGAESSSDETLLLMNKGGTQSAKLMLEFNRRIKTFGIIPEYSFVMGSPSENVERDIDRDIAFIRKLKEDNPLAEIIFYVYAPVFLPGAKIFEESKRLGFEYPRTLEDWVLPKWQHFDLRKQSATPWLSLKHITKMRNFERVLNAYYPTISDLKINDAKRTLMRLVSSWRYNYQFYAAPYEVRFLLSKVLRYRQPEIEGAPQYVPGM